MSDLILAIETSNPGSPEHPNGGIALGTADASLLGLETLGTSADDVLMPSIDRLLRAHGACPGDLVRVGVSAGPGGFTGVRVAVAITKMICEATGAKCVGVSSARVAAHSSKASGGRLGVALASKRESCHLTVFDAEVAGEARIITRDDLAALKLDRLIGDAHLPDSIREGASELGIEIEALRLDPAACLAMAVLGPCVDPADLAAIYPREPEAVRRWRDRQHGKPG